jgi:hypothetical protein
MEQVFQFFRRESLAIISVRLHYLQRHLSQAGVIRITTGISLPVAYKIEGKPLSAEGQQAVKGLFGSRTGAFSCSVALVPEGSSRRHTPGEHGDHPGLLRTNDQDANRSRRHWHFHLAVISQIVLSRASRAMPHKVLLDKARLQAIPML